MSLPGESAILFSAESLKNPIDDIKNLFWHEEVFHIFMGFYGASPLT